MLPSNKCPILWVIVLILLSCGGKKKDPDKIYFEKPSEYNQYINDQFEEVNRLWNATLTRMDDSLLVYNTLDSLREVSNTSVENMVKLADFMGDTAYKGAARQYFQFINKEANGRLAEAVSMGILEEMSDSLYFRFQELGVQIGKEKEIYILQLKMAQKRFIEITTK